MHHKKPITPLRRKSPTPLSNKFGWLPDVPDQRDISFSAVFRMPARTPPQTDLRAKCSPVEQQGELGSCTAQALVGCLEFIELRSFPSPSDKSKIANPKSKMSRFRDLSRLFVYYNERAAMGTVQEDSGAMLRTGIKVLKKLGVCKEDSWPYIISRFAEKPANSCYSEASNHQVTAYQRLSSLSEMKACLAMGLPFVFGFAVYESAMTEKVRRNGVIPMPGKTERMIGGHAVMAVGYDDKRKIFSFRNSWGADWGQEGYGALPYAYFESRELSDDFWCIQATENDSYALKKSLSPRWFLSEMKRT